MKHKTENQTPQAKGSHFSTGLNKPVEEKKSYKPLYIILAILLGIYAIGTLVFYFVLMPNTVLLGDDVSLQTKDSVISSLQRTSNSYSITFKNEDASLKVEGKQIDFSTNPDKIVNNAITQSKPYFWPYEVFIKKTFNMDNNITYDKDNLKSYIADFIEESLQDPEDPRNATIKYDDEQGQFTIEKEVPGSAYSLELCTKKAEECINECKTECVLDDTCKMQPTVLSDDPRLKAAVTKANKLVDISIPIKFQDKDAITITSKEIHDFVDLDENLEPTLNEDRLNEWISKNLVPSFNTVGTKRTYERPDGKDCSVSGGNYGWKIDTKKADQQIIKQVTDRDSTPIVLPVLNKGASFDGIGKKDWGNTYVDVDIDEQKAYFFDEGETKWETDIVTGNSGKKHETPKGVWYVNNKSRKLTLRGPYDEEEEKYEWESEVEYWMSFIGGSYGLHDAPWRSKFGGNIYKWGGSHGCVNLPPQKAEELYGLVKVGTPVIVH